ncbi:MAG: alpha/beta hydrolase [Bacteroidota bacterium]
MMKRVPGILLALVTLILVGYLLGPKVQFEQVDPVIQSLNVPIEELESYIASNESMAPPIKDDNESRILWADGPQKTPWAIVYLHGFSASPMESYPVHVDVARRFGCNIYLPRLSQHGLEDTEAFLELTPTGLVESAKQAVAIGQIIGDRVIVMSCSTGGTLSVFLAANNPEMIDAQVLYSPNIEIFDPTAKLLNDPWGEQILKAVVGDYRESPEDQGTEVEKYWSIRYRSEGLIALQDLLEQTMTPDVFAKVKQPLFMGYYFKNEEEQDQTVSVAAMLNFYEAVGTEESKKVKMAFPSAGAHVITSPLQASNHDIVQRVTEEFFLYTLEMRPVY